MATKKTRKKRPVTVPTLQYCSCNQCNPHEDLIHACVPLFDKAVAEVRKHRDGELDTGANTDSYDGNNKEERG